MSDPKNTEPKKPYRILLVEPSDDDALRFRTALVRLPDFHLAHRVQDANSAIAYLEGEGAFADRRHFPYPQIVMLALNTKQQDGFKLLEWANRCPLRPVIAVFASSVGEVTHRRVEQLGADLFETKTWDPPVFNRFLHFTGNIAQARARFPL